MSALFARLGRDKGIFLVASRAYAALEAIQARFHQMLAGYGRAKWMVFDVFFEAFTSAALAGHFNYSFP
jgi:predicted helicase